MSLVVGTNAYVDLAGADAYHLEILNSDWYSHLSYLTAIVALIGNIQVTSVGHGLTAGASVRLRDTINYDGVHTVLTIIDVDNYELDALYVADETSGTFMLEVEATNREAWLIKATNWINTLVGGKWKGTRSDQTREFPWPRWYVFTPDHFLVEGIPVDLERASAELALRSLLGEDISPDTPAGGQLIMKKVGPITKQWNGHASPHKVYDEVIDLIDPLTTGIRKGSTSIKRT